MNKAIWWLLTLKPTGALLTIIHFEIVAFGLYFDNNIYGKRLT